MIFFCVLFYVYSGRLRQMALPSAILVAVSATAFIAGAFVASDGIRKAAVALLLGGLVLLGPIRRSLPFFVPAGALALPQIIWFTGGVGTEDSPVGWIEGHTSRNAVFLTAFGDPYTVPTLAGRPVYVGGFATWAPEMGYDVESRQKVMVSVYSAPDRTTACVRLRGTGVDYIQVSPSEMQPDRFPLNEKLFRDEFIRSFSDGSISYYDVKASCGATGVAAHSGR